MVGIRSKGSALGRRSANEGKWHFKILKYCKVLLFSIIYLNFYP